ncbi:16S rRNA (cytosine(1402)-N(4))-methyltransferase RsmH [Oscillospiraceae bacterium HV4-5-C5C]|nr:16S rRNA (cytosine(1402)-N(4))-methyltransferase RsmH [Oscillospiraceae bacterium HV4-5-C5C]
MNYHLPVLPEETLTALAPQRGGCYADCTLGGGGHARLILERLGSGDTLLALDRDEEALQNSRPQLCALNQQKPDTKRPALLFAHADFASLKSSLAQLNFTLPACDGILADLGVSSHQLDEPARGFAYSNPGPLDMRMDQTSPLTAAALLRQSSEAELARILKEYGEERYARRIARAIKQREQAGSIKDTAELAAVIISAMPAQARREDQHPARRSFQAIRIAVNDELGELDRFLEQAADVMKPGGRLVIITFHSLEDRMVKNRFRLWADPCICPPDLPYCNCGRKPLGRLSSRKGITASAEEKQQNPRSRSARVRVFERNEQPYQDYRQPIA